MSRKKRKPKTSNSLYKYLIYFLSALSLLLVGFLGGYLIGVNSQKVSNVTTKKIDNEALKTLTKIVKEESKNFNNTTTETKSSESLDYLKAVKKYAKKEPSQKEAVKKAIISHKKPKLVIIIDDVSFKYQVNEIKKLPVQITPSFFPPSKIHPNTYIYAREFKSYMVHLPLQAISFPHEEANTLHVGDSYKKVENRIKTVKALFPNAHFFNNHTGSKYTASKPDMEKLIKALNKYHINFLDSKTTPHIVSPQIYKSLHKHLFIRDVFLDNKQNIALIKNQLKKGVKIAKEKGFAIVIGHPHKTTIEALASSKNILKGVEVISIDKLNSLYQNHKL